MEEPEGVQESVATEHGPRERRYTIDWGDGHRRLKVTMPEVARAGTALRAGAGNNRGDVVRVLGSLYFRDAGLLVWLMLLQNACHSFLGIADLVRVLIGMLLPEDAQSGVVPRRRVLQ